MFLSVKIDTQDWGGILSYFRVGIPCKRLKTNLPGNIEGIFIEMYIHNNKWLLFAGYNPRKTNIHSFSRCWKIPR